MLCISIEWSNYNPIATSTKRNIENYFESQTSIRTYPLSYNFMCVFYFGIAAMPMPCHAMYNLAIERNHFQYLSLSHFAHILSAWITRPIFINIIVVVFAFICVHNKIMLQIQLQAKCHGYACGNNSK